MFLRPSEHEHTVIASRPPFRVVRCDTCTAQPYAVQQERHDAWGGRRGRALPWQTIWCEGDPPRATYIMERHYQNWARLQAEVSSLLRPTIPPTPSYSIIRKPNRAT